MPMTKAEQAKVAEMRERDAVLRAIAYPQFPRPVPMEYALGQDTGGWKINVEREVKGYGDGVRFIMPHSMSGFGLYPTEQDAYRALAYAVADHFGKVMAQVYAKCSEQEGA